MLSILTLNWSQFRPGLPTGKKKYNWRFKNSYNDPKISYSGMLLFVTWPIKTCFSNDDIIQYRIMFFYWLLFFSLRTIQFQCQSTAILKFVNRIQLVFVVKSDPFQRSNCFSTIEKREKGRTPPPKKKDKIEEIIREKKGRNSQSEWKLIGDINSHFTDSVWWWNKFCLPIVFIATIHL